MDTIDNIPTMGVVLAYCREHHIPCWVIQTKPEHRDMPYAGTSAELMSLTATEATIRIANGDVSTVPASTITMRVKH